MPLIKQLQRIGKAQGVAMRVEVQVLNRERQTLLVKDCLGTISDMERPRLKALQRKVGRMFDRLHPMDLSHLEALAVARKKLAKRVQRALALVERLQRERANEEEHTPDA